MKTAMILAAGRGERLRPLTDERPKALCEVNSKPLIEYHVEKLAKAGFEHIVINHAYLGGQIRRHFGNGQDWDINISYSPEPTGGLETGGGIYNALPLLGKEPFITINADIYTDFDFASLNLSTDFARLILIENPQHNQGDFGLNEQHEVTNQKQYTFTGIACYHPSIFKTCKVGRYSVVPLIRELAEKKLVKGEFFQGLWIDIGSPERLHFANNLVKQRA